MLVRGALQGTSCPPGCGSDLVELLEHSSAVALPAASLCLTVRTIGWLPAEQPGGEVFVNVVERVDER